MEPAALVERRDSPDSDAVERKEEEGSRKAAAAAAPEVPAAATSRIRITQDCVAGGPITCVSLVAASSSSVVCVYGHGPFLHRTRIITTTVSASDNHRNNESDGSQRPLLVFPDGGSIHGIRYDQQTNNDGTPPPLTVLYGGRQVAFVRNVTDLNAPMEVLAIVDARNHENDPEEETTKHHLTLGDWIWDVRLYDGGSSRKQDGENDTSSSSNERSSSVWRTIPCKFGLWSKKQLQLHRNHHRQYLQLLLVVTTSGKEQEYGRDPFVRFRGRRAASVTVSTCGCHRLLLLPRQRLLQPPPPLPSEP